MEMLLGLLMRSYSGAEDLVLSVLQQENDSLQPRADLAPASTPASMPTVDPLSSLWRRSGARRCLQDALAGSEPGDDEDSFLQRLEEKVTNKSNSLLDRGRDEDARQEPPELNPVVDFENLQADDSIAPTTGSVGAPEHESTNKNSNESPTLPSDWPNLIERYLAHTHCWLPAVEKFTLFRSANLLNGATLNTSDRKMPTPGDIASLWAALAVGSHSAKARNTGPPHMDAEGLGSQPLLRVARRLSEDNDCVHEIGHVHAALMLAALELERGNPNLAWIWTGRAIYLSTTLNLVPSSQDLQVRTPSEVDKRLLRACFLMDAITSTRLGHRPYLESSDLRRVGPIDVDGIEEWETWKPSTDPSRRMSVHAGPCRALSTFNAIGDLLALLSSSSKTTIDSDNKRKHEQLFSQYIQLEENIALLKAEFLGFQGSWASLPPNLALLRIVATTVYLTLRNRLRAVTHVSAGIQTCKSTVVMNTMSMIYSPDARRTALFQTPLSAVILVFCDLLDKVNMERSRQSLEVRLSPSDLVASRMTAMAEPTCRIPALELGDIQGCTAPSYPRSDELNVSEFSNSAAGPRLPQVRSTEVDEHVCPLNEELREPLPGNLEALGGKDGHLALHPPSSVLNTTTTFAEVGMSPAGAAAAASHGDDEDLFGQLSLLDDADWYACSRIPSCAYLPHD